MAATYSFIISLASLIGTGVAYILFYGVKKRSQHLDNEAKASEQWQKLYYESKADSDRKELKINELSERLYKELEEKSAKEQELARLKVLKCERVGCTDRQPPTGY